MEQPAGVSSRRTPGLCMGAGSHDRRARYDGGKAPLCGKLLSPKDRKVWKQAIALLMELKVRNGFGEKDLAGAVERALHRGTRCEDCRIKVASGAAC